MSSLRPDPLLLAFEAAVGRSPAAGRGGPLLAFAQRVVAAGQRLAAALACPAAARRRAEALFVPPAARGVRGLLRLLFDSFAPAALAPALRGRGGPRALRFGGPQGSLDLEIEALPDGRRQLRVALDSTLARESPALLLRAGGRARRVTLRAGVGTQRLARDVRRVTIELRRGRALVARTPTVTIGKP